ncbi:MAG TPA: DUF4845 domain-containing protein [Pseudomonadales bacterium]
MKTKYFQKGASMQGVLFVVAVAAFFLMTAFKVVPVYIEAGNIKTAIQSLDEVPGITKMSKQKIKSTIQQKLDMNAQRDVDLSSLEVSSESDKMIITFNYDRRVPWIQNIDLMLHFENEYIAVKH